MKPQQLEFALTPVGDALNLIEDKELQEVLKRFRVTITIMPPIAPAPPVEAARSVRSLPGTTEDGVSEERGILERLIRRRARTEGKHWRDVRNALYDQFRNRTGIDLQSHGIAKKKRAVQIAEEMGKVSMLIELVVGP